MVFDLFAILWAPFLMCLVLTGIHAYLGVHVLAREVVFVDIAMAQIAALGATAAFLQGYEIEQWESYAYSLAATLLGALVLSITRSRRRNVSQEAVSGIVYAVSSAAAVLLADRAPHGAEQVRTMLVGNLLAVRPFEVGKVFILYSLVGLMHWFCRRPFLLISTDPRAAFEAGWRVRLWDFFFYASFGVVVASSVRIAGVLLVFSYLIVPALAGVMLGGTVAARLLIGWAFGTVVSVIGMVASAALDLPTGATVVCAFGVTLIAFWIATRVSRRLAALGAGPATPAGCATAPPSVGSLVGEWHGRISTPRGHTAARLTLAPDGRYEGAAFFDGGDRPLHGAIVALPDGRLRYVGSEGDGKVRGDDGATGGVFRRRIGP